MIVLTHYVAVPDMPDAVQPMLPVGVLNFRDTTIADGALGKPTFVECDDADAAKFDATYYIILGSTDLSVVPPQADIDAFIALVESWGIIVSTADRAAVNGMPLTAALEYAKKIMRGL